MFSFDRCTKFFKMNIGFSFKLIVSILLVIDSSSIVSSLLLSRRRYQEGPQHRTPFNDNVVPCGAFKFVRVNESLVIQSPNFNKSETSSNSNSCRWRFLFPACSLAISCPSFRLNDFFCLDYFEIKDTNGKTQKYCGRRGPNLQINTFNKQVEMTYKTSSFFNSVGFRCQLSCLDDSENSISGTGNPSTGGIFNPGGRPGNGDGTVSSAPKSNCSCGEGAHGMKIVNGEMTAIGDFSWVAGLVRAGSVTPFCGGSLINSRYVLTAAHCVSGRTPSTLEIILNEPGAEVGIEAPSPPMRRKIEAILPHRKYGTRLDYDAALIKLSEPIDLNSDIVPVCLPNDSTEDYLKKSATVSGWGTTSEGGSLSRYLLKADVDVISNEQCSIVYPFVITSRMLCAYRENKDACQGDSGGPLMLIEAQGKKVKSSVVMEIDSSVKAMAYAKCTQIGIVSWGQGCARPNKPGVYSRITEFLPWIYSIVNDGSFCES